jgi:hypothetical protein
VVFRVGRWSSTPGANGDGGGSAVARARRNDGPVIAERALEGWFMRIKAIVKSRHGHDMEKTCGDVCGTAATPLGGRRGRRGATRARMACGARGEGGEGDSAWAVPRRADQQTVAGLSVQAQRVSRRVRA